MNLNHFIQTLNTQPETINFTDTMSVIEYSYHFSPAAFNNGEFFNEADQNNGSCKLFAFAQLHQLSEAQTLACFGHYYRDDVLSTPDGEGHKNIRNFMKSGWDGIKFEAMPLTPITPLRENNESL